MKFLSIKDMVVALSKVLVTLALLGVFAFLFYLGFKGDITRHLSLDFLTWATTATAGAITFSVIYAIYRKISLWHWKKKQVRGLRDILESPPDTF